MKPYNETHRIILEELKSKGIEEKQIQSPVMLSASQYDNCYSVSVGYKSIGLKIDKNRINEEEINSLPSSMDYRIFVNHIWMFKPKNQ